MTSILQTVSCLDDYDPDALRVDKANEAIRACLAPIRETEKVPVREALGRVLAEDIVPAINVPANDNSAMDGYALRFSDLKPGETALTEVGTAFAGRVFEGKLGAGECVRVMTGAVMPPGSDTVVIQEVTRKEGNRVVIPPGQKQAQNVRYAGEDLKAGVAVLRSGKHIGPADLGMIASLGLGQVKVKRRLKVAFFATGDELASIGAPLKEGEVYDSNRYTLYAMLTRLGVELNDLGVVRDDPKLLESAFRRAAESADAVITTGGVSVGEADFTRELMAVAVMVTFYQFVRDALLHLSGRTDEYAIPLLKVAASQALRKVPGRTEYQRGILFKEGNEWKVRTSGQQGSGVLRSMSEANCFIVLEHARGKVDAGELVQVQLFEGLV
jgi:molybdopterin molybdotransferase